MRTYGEITLRRGPPDSWKVEAEPHVVMRFKRVFARTMQEKRDVISVQHNDEVCRDLLWFLDRYPLQVSVEDLAYMHRESSSFVERTTLVNDLIAHRIAPADVKLALPLRDYQRVAVDAAVQARSILIADEVGIGKTCEGIGVLARPDALPALVVTMTHLPRQWEEEIHRFAPSLRTHILKKGTPYDLSRLDNRGKQLGLPFTMPDVIITNYHKLAGWQETLGPVVRSVVFDEIQELRNSGSAKYEAAKHVSEGAKYRIGLSATPVMNYGGDIYNVLNVLRPDVVGSFYEFQREWCQNGGRHVVLSDPEAFGAYVRDIGMMLRRTRADAGRELPPLTKIVQTVECDDQWLNESAGAVEELARLILRQGGKGFEKMQASQELDWRLRQATGIGKAKYVADFVRMLVANGERVVVYGWHIEVYKILMQHLHELNPVMYTGSETAAQKDEAKRRFIDGDAKVLLMSLRAGAGLDGLQHVCRTVVFAELDWAHGTHTQNIGRVFRDGQRDPVVAYFLVAESGSDPIVMDVLGLKKYQAEGVTDPDAPAIETSQADPDHVRKLAEGYLKQRAVKEAS